MKYFGYFLLAFGGIALVVGGFVIANTLAITIAQRTRELATLRTLGASRRQVLASVVLEAVVVGAVASIAGIFVGLGLAEGLKALLDAIGVELPAAGTVVAARTIVVSLAVGVLVTLFASLRPALRATRVPAIAAVREGAVLPRSRLARLGAAPGARGGRRRGRRARLRAVRRRPSDRSPAGGARRRGAAALRRRRDDRPAADPAARARARLARDAARRRGRAARA